MPLWLALLIIGIVLVVAARYWITDPLFSRWAYGGGVLCIIIAVILFMVGLLGLASLRVGMTDGWSMTTLAGGFLVGGTLDTGAVGDPVVNPPEPDPLAPKAWYESRTFWFNGLAALATVAYALAQIVSQNPTGLDPRIVGAAGVILTVGNLYLRQGTTAPIAGTNAQRKVERARMMDAAAAPPPATLR